MEALTLPALYKLIEILRRFFPRLDGTLVNLVAIGVGLALAFGAEVTFFEEAADILNKIASGITIGLGASATDITLKAVRKAPTPMNIASTSTSLPFTTE